MSPEHAWPRAAVSRHRSHTGGAFHIYRVNKFEVAALELRRCAVECFIVIDHRGAHIHTHMHTHTHTHTHTNTHTNIYIHTPSLPHPTTTKHTHTTSCSIHKVR